MPGCDRSALTFGRGANRGSPMSSLRAQWSSSESSVWAFAGMSDSSSSRTIFCDCTARGLSVSTSMPAFGERQHDGASTRSPLTSTTQARQLPSGRMPGL